MGWLGLDVCICGGRIEEGRVCGWGRKGREETCGQRREKRKGVAKAEWLVGIGLGSGWERAEGIDGEDGAAVGRCRTAFARLPRIAMEIRGLTPPHPLPSSMSMK